MQKTLDFLEQNVQWLALGLAAVFFGFCVWAYVITPPAVVTASGSKEPLTPANIDEVIHNGPVQEIERSRNGMLEVAIAVPDVVKPWQAQMTAPKMTALTRDYPPPLYPQGEIYDPTKTPGGPSNAGTLVKAFPELPKATPQIPLSGLSVVSTPVQTQGGAQAVAASNFDIEWATATFVIPAAGIKDSFSAVQKVVDALLQKQGLPPIQLNTDVLKVELQRQRGTWGANGPVFPNGDAAVEVVPPSKIQPDIRPMPDDKAQLPEKVSYYEWAEKNLEVVCQPKFYDVHGGSPWTAPALGQAGAPAPAAPAAVGVPKGLAGIPPAMPLRGANPAQPFPGGLGAAAGAAGQKNPGQIIPANITQDILVWSHDDSVQPGQTYRYRIVYYMKNPVMGLKGVADPSIVETLPVKSPPSDWSQPVTIPKVTQFWFANVRTGGAAADVYHWENGAWTKKPGVMYQPGDHIADSEWTVVDVHGQEPRAREREKYVILTNDAGEVIRRFPGIDRFSDEKKGLDAQINPGAAAGTGGANPPPPNTPPARPAPGQRAGVMPRGGG
jgi:hypothetical protein